MIAYLNSLILLIQTALVPKKGLSLEAAHKAVAKFNLQLKRGFDPNEARDHGKWTRTGASFDPKKEKWMDNQGKPLSKADHARLDAIPAIHKRMVGVQLHVDPKSGLQAIGYPLKADGTVGQRKWFYSDDHKVKKYKAKWAALGEFDTAKRILEKASYTDAMNGSPAAACVFAMDRTGQRIGNAKSTTKDDPTFGVTQLEARHVKVKGNTVTFAYQAKGDKPYSSTITDAKLASVVRAFLTTPEGTDKKSHDRLFPTTDDTVRAYMNKTANEGKKGKDKMNLKPHMYRHWHATNIAAYALKRMGKPVDAAQAIRYKRMACEAVAGFLNNTPEVAYQDYISPVVWKDWPTALRPAPPKLSKSAGLERSMIPSPSMASSIIAQIMEENVFPEFPDEEDLPLDEVLTDGDESPCDDGSYQKMLDGE